MVRFLTARRVISSFKKPNWANQWQLHVSTILQPRCKHDCLCCVSELSSVVFGAPNPNTIIVKLGKSTPSHVIGLFGNLGNSRYLKLYSLNHVTKGFRVCVCVCVCLGGGGGGGGLFDECLWSIYCTLWITYCLWFCLFVIRLFLFHIMLECICYYSYNSVRQL